MADEQQQDQQQQQQQQQGQGQQQDQQRQDQQQQQPEWLGTLTDEALRGNEHLARYKSIDDLAKGHVETMTWARGRVPLPKADDAKGREDFVAKARPEKWEDYEVPIGDGQTDTTRADGFKQKAHALGLMPWQAKELADWSNAYEGDAVSKMQQAAKDELTTREVNMGPAGFARGNQAITNMFAGIEGVEPDKVMAGLESAYGAGATYDFLLKMAQKTGELDKVSGEDISLRLGTMTKSQAQAELTRLDADKDFFDKAKLKDSPEYKKRDQLMRIISSGA